MRSSLVALAAAALSATAGPRSPVPVTHTMRYGGLERSYALYRPASAGTRALPVVIALHGLGGNGAQFLQQGRWQAEADRYGFVLLAPDGVLPHPNRRESFLGNARSWNSGPETGSEAALRGIDDVGYIAALLDTIESRMPVDRDRIYVTGFSNGAAMAFRVAAELSDRIAAAAPVANALLMPVSHLPHPVSLLMIWGTDDPLNPPAGGLVKRSAGTVLRSSATETLATWRRLLGCGVGTNTEPLGPGVVRTEGDACPPGSDAELVMISGLGHQWPGGRDYLRALAGRGTDRFDATEYIWQFFAGHPRRGR